MTAVAAIGVPGLHFHDLRHKGVDATIERERKRAKKQGRDGDDDGTAASLAKVSQWPVNGPTRSTDGLDVEKSGWDHGPDLAIVHGAGEGNRTPAVSLGS